MKHMLPLLVYGFIEVYLTLYRLIAVCVCVCVCIIQHYNMFAILQYVA